MRRRVVVIVSAVSSGTEALALLSKGPVPRMVIADYSLRGQLGTDVVETIRSALGQDVPAVIITADVEPTITDRIASCGFPLLIKPVSPPRLRVMMHHLLFEPSEARQTPQIE
jgi:CheY-like chemotaxis protein